MRWQGRKGSSNVEDRRQGGGGGGSRGRGKQLGIIGTLVVLGLAYFLDINPQQLMSVAEQVGGTTKQEEYVAPSPNDELGQFVSVVLKDSEDVWDKLFREQFGKSYQRPKLVLFSGKTTSACGAASSATGPFYCPADQKVYIDLSFYRDLKERFGAPGDFAMAYVVAHEVGHHVQYLLGITRQVDSQRGRISEEAYNQLSVRLELQADFLAGTWAHHAQKMKNILEEGDIQEALRAAQAIGDDRLQMQTQGYVVPESFTHGTSEQRMRWFSKGLKSGDLREMDTFQATNL